MQDVAIVQSRIEQLVGHKKQKLQPELSLELEPEIGAANIGFKDDDLAFCCWPLFA